MLFKPTSKVQKDRAIMRDTDFRMAKYSRRGLILNLLAYLLCLSLGDFHIVAPTTAVVLTTGLIITLLIRGYILFRFNAIYSCGPARWRSMFFIVTLIGAAWWSGILVCLTLILGMVSETPILWLYTVIFFSTTIQVTAPFRDFSRVYLAVALLPPALTAFYSGGFDGYMYGLMMVVFIITLDHQAEMLSSTHWQRLAANLELKQKARALEIEKRKVDASVRLNTQFLKSLWAELYRSNQCLQECVSGLDKTKLSPDMLEQTDSAAVATETQQQLLQSIDTFTHLNNHEMEFEVTEFPLRASLERWLDQFQKEAEANHIDLSFRMYPEVPESAQGDPKLLQRIFSDLLGNAIKYSDDGEIFVDFDFRPGKDDIGQLEITIVDRCTKSCIEGAINLEKMLQVSRFSGLWYPICKSLAELLGGGIETDHDEKEIRYLIRMPMVMAESQQDEPAAASKKGL